MKCFRYIIGVLLTVCLISTAIFADEVGSGPWLPGDKATTNTAVSLEDNASYSIAQNTSFAEIAKDYSIEISLILLAAITIALAFLTYRGEVQRKRTEQLLDTDSITGLDSEYKFRQKANKILDSAAPGEYSLNLIDIDGFKLINEQFSEEYGDQLLREVANAIVAVSPKDTVITRWEADDFVLLIKNTKDFNCNGFLETLQEEILKTVNTRISLHMGIYKIEDPTLKISSIYDRSLLALKSVKDNNRKKIGIYEAEMYAELVEKQSLTADMEKALKNREFIVYLQPQVNYDTKNLIGAEALVRWNHPQKGMIAPNIFIPLFEKNGFISKLDYYIWEECCKYLKKWQETEDNVLPISANVSRVDCYDLQLANKLITLIKKYDISPSLLKLEITESAYQDNPDQLIQVVNELKSAGFTVAMDDFGAGYSSLNILKDVPFDILKLDLNFLAGEEKNDRGGNILSSVIRMAHWLKIPVIAEGVSTKSQAEYLSSLGCLLMQGYYFDTPIPISKFEELYNNTAIQWNLGEQFTDNIQGAADFISASTQSTLLFNSFVGGAGIAEYDGKHLEAIRLNNKFFEVMGTTKTEFSGKQVDLLATVYQDYKDKCIEAVKAAISTGEEKSCELHILPLSGENNNIWIRVTFRLLAYNDGRHIFYFSIINMTELVETQNKNAQLSKQLSSIIDSVPGGILDMEKTDHVRIAYFNDEILALCGFSREKYIGLFCETPYDAVHPEDIEEFRTKIESALEGETTQLKIKFRHICSNGKWKWLQFTGKSVNGFDGKICLRIILIDEDEQVKKDLYAAKQGEELERQHTSLQALYDSIPCGILELDAKSIKEQSTVLLGFNDTVWQLCGYYSRTQYLESISGKSVLKDIHPEDIERVEDCLFELYKAPHGTQREVEHRIIRFDSTIRWVSTTIRKTCYANGDEIIQLVFSDITYLKHAGFKQIQDIFYDLYDEIFEFDIEEKIVIKQSSNQSQSQNKIISLDYYLESLISAYAVQEDARALTEFYHNCRVNIEKKSDTLEFRYLDKNQKQRWASVTLLRIDATKFLSCNKDITKEKEANDFDRKNQVHRELIEQCNIENARNQLFIEEMDVIIYDYDVLNDKITFQYKDVSGAVIEKTTADFLATVNESAFFNVEGRNQIQQAFSKAKETPTCTSIELKSNAFQPEFKPYRVALTSIADEDGRIYRIIGHGVLMKESAEDNNTVYNTQRAAREKSQIEPWEIEKIFDQSPSYLYIVDANTYEVLYYNQSMLSQNGRPGKKETCFKAFGKQENICELCPIKTLKSVGIPTPMVDYIDGEKYIIQASHIRWQEKEAILISGNNASCFSETPEEQRKNQYQFSITKYAETLSCLFDEIYELDFIKNTFTPLYSNYVKDQNKYIPMDLNKAIERWLARTPEEEEKIKLKDFVNIDKIYKLFQQGITPSIEYVAYQDKDYQGICQATLMPLDTDHYLCCNKDITKEKRAEELQNQVNSLKLQGEIQERYRIIVEQTGTAVVEMNYENNYVSSTEAYKKYAISLCKPEDLMKNQGDRSLVHPEDQDKVEEFFRTFEAITTSRYKNHAEVTLRLKMMDGTFRWTQMAGTYLRDEKGNFTKVIGTFTDVEEEMRSKISLEELTNRMNHIITNIPAGVGIFEVQDKVYPIYVSDRTCEMFGFTPNEYALRIANGEAVSSTAKNTKPPENIKEKIASGDTFIIPKIHAQKKDGSWFWLRACCSANITENQKIRYHVILIDISEEVEKEQQQNWQNEKYMILSENAETIIFDYSPQEDIMTISLHHPEKGCINDEMHDYLKTFHHYPRIHKDDKDEFEKLLRKVSKKAMRGTHEFRADYFQNGMRWYQAKYVSLADDDNEIYRVVGRIDDINDLKLLSENAQMDELTKVYNKGYASSAIADALKNKNPEELSAFLFMDIDNFKQVNDTYGHLEADKVLYQIGKILHRICPKDSIIARFGGDEFIIYVKFAANIENIKIMAKELIKAISNIDTQKDIVHCSIGIAGISKENIGYEEALTRADAALYRAKENGKNRYEVWDNL